MSKVIENYLLNEIVGSGSYGQVHRSTHQISGGTFAVKVISLEKFRSVPKLEEFTRNEVGALTRLRNINVIRFVEMLRSANNLYLVYEFCSGGTLEDLIKKRRYLCEREALILFSQILNAFASLFAEKVLHRDLKPSNILLHDGLIKVADFGFCKTLLCPSDLTQTMVGSPIYMAPEILKGMNYNAKADIWSMGVVLFEMLFGFCPYEDKTIASLIGQLETKKLIIPRNINPISQSLHDLLLRMLTVDQNRRIEWTDLLAHPIFDATPLLKQARSLAGVSSTGSVLTTTSSSPHRMEMVMVYRARMTSMLRIASEVLKSKDERLSPVVAFLLMKCVQFYAECVRDQTNSFAESTQRQLLLKEVETINVATSAFRREIEKVLTFNTDFTLNACLRKEQNQAAIDFDFFKSSLIAYAEAAAAVGGVQPSPRTNVNVAAYKHAQTVLNCVIEDSNDSGQQNDNNNQQQGYDLRSALAQKLSQARNKSRPHQSLLFV